jgi:hypothetical protein
MALAAMSRNAKTLGLPRVVTTIVASWQSLAKWRRRESNPKDEDSTPLGNNDLEKMSRTLTAPGQRASDVACQALADLGVSADSEKLQRIIVAWPDLSDSTGDLHFGRCGCHQITRLMVHLVCRTDVHTLLYRLQTPHSQR